MKFLPQQQQPGRCSHDFQQQKAEIWGAAILAAGAVGSTVYGAQQQKSAANKSAQAAAQSGVDIGSLDQQARDLAKRNIADSVALEKQYNPSVYALREQATAALLPYTTGQDPLSSASKTLRTDLYGDFAGAKDATLTKSQLLDEAVNKARAELALGGTLSTATRNEATRKAAANAASVGGGGLGLARDLTARDLGLTSMQVLQNRLNNATTLGGADQAYENAAANYGLQNQAQRLSTASLISDLGQQDYNRLFGLAQFGQSLARPESGLDSSSLVNLVTGNQNALNAGRQNAAAVQAQTGNSFMGLGGNLLGVAGGLFANRGQSGSGGSGYGYFSNDAGGDNVLGTYVYTPSKK